MTDILDRVFGPEPADQTFAVLNPAKVIPLHDCEYVDARVWVWAGMVTVQQCPVCKQRPPE